MKDYLPPSTVYTWTRPSISTRYKTSNYSYLFNKKSQTNNRKSIKLQEKNILGQL